jgi:hypothetical protein
MSAKAGAIIVVIVVVALFATYVWPTRYIYGSEKTGENTHVIRIDRFSERVWILTAKGWKERSTSDSIFQSPAPSSDPFWTNATQSQTQNPAGAAVQPAAAPKTPTPKPLKLKWATVNDDTSIFKRCHFESGNRNVDGCDFVMAMGDPYPSAMVVLKKGERVALLSDSVRSSGGEYVYKVKFQQWTGWMDAADVNPE